MAADKFIRWGWLKFMYIYTIIGAGAMGVVIIFAPDVIRSVFHWPFEEPISMGIVASVYVAFGVLSVFGLWSPLKFAPILLLQLCYKSVWFGLIILPLVVTGKLPAYSIFFVIIFATYIIGDLIAIPFSYIFAKPMEKTS